MEWTQDAQKAIAKLFEKEFGNESVKTQWRSHAKNKDWLKLGKVYAPYPDIVIGPFNIHSSEYREIENILEAFKQHGIFFQELLGENISNKNENPRCLLAIEIEHSGTGKYMIGNIINASILGYIGIVVVDKKLLQNVKMVKKYLEGASKIKEIGNIAKNTAIFEYNEFIDRLEKARSLGRG